MSDFSAGEDRAGLVIPRWRVTGGDGLEVLDVSSVCGVSPGVGVWILPVAIRWSR